MKDNGYHGYLAVKTLCCHPQSRLMVDDCHFSGCVPFGEGVCWRARLLLCADIRFM